MAEFVGKLKRASHCCGPRGRQRIGGNGPGGEHMLIKANEMVSLQARFIRRRPGEMNWGFAWLALLETTSAASWAKRVRARAH